MQKTRKATIFAIVFALIFNIAAAAFAQTDERDQILSTVTQGLYAANSDPTVAAIGGDWTVTALSRSNAKTDESYYERYSQAVSAYLSTANTRRYTDYARILIALKSAGLPTRGIEEFLCDYAAVTAQGINGAIFALIALDGIDAKAADREYYLKYLLKAQHTDGGYGLSEDSDADLTAMALQALAPYRDRAEVTAAVDAAVEYLTASEIKSSETASQIIIAMTALGASADAYVDILMGYYEDGGFAHLMGGGKNLMATEQAACALTADYRYRHGLSALYQIGKADGFRDVEAADMPYLSLLCDKGVIKGRTPSVFAPDELITRAEFAAVIIRAMETQIQDQNAEINPFKDVAADAWYRDYCVKANASTLMQGVAADEFAPDLNITREMAMTVLTRLCLNLGLETKTCPESAIADYADISSWALIGVMNAYANGYFTESPCKPKQDITRIEVVRMLGKLLISLQQGAEIEVQPTPKPTTAPLKDAIAEDEGADGDESEWEHAALTKRATIAISCHTALGYEGIDADVAALLPADGVMLMPTEIETEDGMTVYDVLMRAADLYGLEIGGTDSYISAINGLGEFSCGALSGWMYAVNGEFLELAVSEYVVNDGDEIELMYTCDLGADIGAGV